MSDLKAQYLHGLLAPLDGMWDVGFIGPSPHLEIRWDGERAGYYVANEEGALLQFYVSPAFRTHARAFFDHIAGQESLTKAVASTIDPPFLSLCLDVQKAVAVHTLLYERHTAITPAHPEAEGLG